MEECFTFQWGGGCFSDRRGGVSFLSGRGGPHEGALVLMVGGGGRKKL